MVVMVKANTCNVQLHEVSCKNVPRVSISASADLAQLSLLLGDP